MDAGAPDDRAVDPVVDPAVDPVLVRRARIARLVDVGQKTGYALFGVAIVAFMVGLFTSFSSAIVVIVIGALVVGSLVLAPAIVFGFAVKAAERDDRERARERAARKRR